jgi:hypothetical protein
MRITHKSILAYQYLFIRSSEWNNIYGQQTVSNVGKKEPVSVEVNVAS